MPSADELPRLRELARLRDLARRARRLAEHFDGDDRTRLLAHAEELERDAAEIKRSSTDDVPDT